MRIVTYRPWYAADRNRSGRSRQGSHPLLDRLHDDMNRLFEESFGQVQEMASEMAEFAPSVDVEQDDDHYSVALEIPGVRREDVSVDLRDDTLVISGTKHRSAKSERSESVQSTRRFGQFSQALSLPDDADREGIEAEFADGVLSVTIPRDKDRERGRVRRIEVRGGDASDDGRRPADRASDAVTPGETSFGGEDPVTRSSDEVTSGDEGDRNAAASPDGDRDERGRDEDEGEDTTERTQEHAGA